DMLADRVPGALRNGLREVQQVDAAHRQLVWMDMVAHESIRPLWRKVCPKGASVIAEVVREGRKDGGLFVYQRCKLHEMDLLDVNHALESGAAEILIAHA